MLSISCLTTSSGQQRSDLGTGSPHHPLQAPWAHQIRGHEEELHLLTVQKANMAAGHFAFSAEGKKEKKNQKPALFQSSSAWHREQSKQGWISCRDQSSLPAPSIPRDPTAPCQPPGLRCTLLTASSQPLSRCAH